MCGIIGYVGKRDALPVLLDGLSRLEYRGYDSAGVALINEAGSLDIRKQAGRIENLRAKLDGDLRGTMGIAHTRWATHGAPFDRNAHPHQDCKGQIAVTHNGIIENYTELRSELELRGHKFSSDTDTEVIPHLIEEYLNGDLEEAVRRAVSKLKGSYALAVMSSLEPGVVIGVREQSPLIVGFGKDEYFLASDIPALLPYTCRVCILEDGQIAKISSNGVTVKWITGERVANVHVAKVNWEPSAAEKGGFPHFMLKEIHEQPAAVRDTLRGRLDSKTKTISMPELSVSLEAIGKASRVYMVACGTAYHAALVGKKLMEKLARIPVEVELASEFRYGNPILDEKSVLVAVSQSGETADTIAAVREAKRRGALTIAVTNVVGSSIARECDEVVYTRAGPEIAVASTKAYVTQLVVLTLLALNVARSLGRINDEEFEDIVNSLEGLPQKIQEVLALESEVQRIAKKLRSTEDVFFIGRGLDYAVCLEGQLKLKEISYIHAEAYAAGELKHGTLALITEGVPVIALLTQPEVLNKAISNVAEVKARGGNVVAVAPKGTDLKDLADYRLELPWVHEICMPVVAVVPLQLLAYYTAVERGCDVDKPRNLAKSVTVE